MQKTGGLAISFAYFIYYCKLCKRLRYNLGVLSNYAPREGTVVAFCGRILDIGRKRGGKGNGGEGGEGEKSSENARERQANERMDT